MCTPVDLALEWEVLYFPSDQSLTTSVQQAYQWKAHHSYLAGRVLHLHVSITVWFIYIPALQYGCAFLYWYSKLLRVARRLRVHTHKFVNLNPQWPS